MVANVERRAQAWFAADDATAAIHELGAPTLPIPQTADAQLSNVGVSLGSNAIVDDARLVTAPILESADIRLAAVRVAIEPHEEGGSTILVLQQVYRDETLEFSDLHGETLALLSSPEGYDTETVSLSIRSRDPLAEDSELSVELEVESIKVGVAVDKQPELDLITERLIGGGLWQEDRRTETGRYLVRADGLAGDLFARLRVNTNSVYVASFRAG